MVLVIPKLRIGEKNVAFVLCFARFLLVFYHRILVHKGMRSLRFTSFLNNNSRRTVSFMHFCVSRNVPFEKRTDCDLEALSKIFCATSVKSIWISVVRYPGIRNPNVSTSSIRQPILFHHFSSTFCLGWLSASACLKTLVDELASRVTFVILTYGRMPRATWRTIAISVSARNVAPFCLKNFHFCCLILLMVFSLAVSLGLPSWFPFEGLLPSFCVCDLWSN